MRTPRAGLTVALLFALCGSRAAAQQDTTITEEKPGLLAQATITPAQAKGIALSRVAKGTIVKGEIEQEDGRLVYSFDITVPGKSGIEEVLVDAKSGKVISVEHEDEAAEAAEKDSTPPKKP